MAELVAILLMFGSDEEVFLIMCHLIEKILPTHFYFHERDAQGLTTGIRFEKHIISEMFQTYYGQALFSPARREITSFLFESEIESMLRYFFIQHLPFPTWMTFFNRVLETGSVLYLFSNSPDVPFRTSFFRDLYLSRSQGE